MYFDILFCEYKKYPYIRGMEMNNNIKNEPINIIDIPQIGRAMFENNQKKYYANDSDFYGSCPCCGKGIKEPKFFINSIFGAQMYPSNDTNEYDDAWTMPVGSECIKKIPTQYVIKGA